MSKDNKLIAKALSTMTLAQIEFYLNNVDKLEKVLDAPPTADKVCKALSEYWKAEVKYNPNRNHGFYLVMSGIYFMCLDYGGEVHFYRNDYIVANSYPPHLITMIGSFYEGLEK